MKKQWEDRKMTLLVIRNADQAVKQFRVSKWLLYMAPAIVVASVSAAVVHLEMRSAAAIEQLQSALRDQSSQYGLLAESKDETIEELQNEVILLSGQAKEVKSRVEELRKLEGDLRQFINTYGGTGNKAVLESLQDSDDIPLDSSGGEFIPVTDEEIMELAETTNVDFNELKRLMGDLRQTMSFTLAQAYEKQHLIEITPTLWPTSSLRLSSRFGYRTDPLTRRPSFHAGIDIAGNTGDPVYAAANGKVIEAERDGTRGKYIIVEHPNGLKTWYMHLSKIDAKLNSAVKRGQKIGEVGSTGRSTGPHLHFQITQNDATINPLIYLNHE